MFEAGMEPIPGHRLTCCLGRGATSEVWEAKLSNGKVLAIKFLDCRNYPSILVANEIRVLLKLRDLRHPCIIQMLDVCATASYIALKMERAEGNLRELQEVYLQELGRPIPNDYLLDLLDSAGQGLDFLAEQHRPGFGFSSQGMQHCDVKPTNLLILADGLKIADFGLCMSSLSQTHNSRFMGTIPYAAPELYEGRITSHTDQYALAVTYCELATAGRVLLPLDPNSRRWTCPVDQKKLRANEHPVIMRALDPNWTNRWPNCKSFIKALRAAVSEPRQPVKQFGSRQLAILPRSDSRPHQKTVL